MKKLLLLFTLLVGISLHCAAQNYTEVVYLKNGSIQQFAENTNC